MSALALLRRPVEASRRIRLDAGGRASHPSRMMESDAEARRGTLIVAIARHQDRGAFADLFTFYAPRLKGQAMRFGLSAEAAEDVAQETMLAVWRRAAQFDDSRGTASAWIFTIATNARLDRLRRDARLQAAQPLDGAALEVPEASVAADILDAGRVAPLVVVLPDDQKRVLDLSFYQGASHGEISKALGIPLGTVKSRLRLALKKLRDALGEAP